MMVDFELFIKYFSGEASPEEAEQVETFAQSSPEGYAYVQSLFNSWLESGGEHYEKPDVHKEWAQFNAQHLGQPAKRRVKKMALAAALAVLLGLVGYFAYFNQRPSTERISVVAQHGRTIILADSSKVTMAPGSNLQYPKSFHRNSRELDLWGDADFEVYHDSKWPFVIHLKNDLNITVTGTVFSVRETDEKVTVALREGSILFNSPTSTLPLTAGQTGQFLIKENKFLLLVPELKTGSFQFNDMPLEQVAVRLDRYFQVRIHFKNPEIAHCQLSAGMKDKNLEEIIQIIAITFNLDYYIEKDNIYFEGPACY